MLKRMTQNSTYAAVTDGNIYNSKCVVAEQTTLERNGCFSWLSLLSLAFPASSNVFSSQIPLVTDVTKLNFLVWKCYVQELIFLHNISWKVNRLISHVYILFLIASSRANVFIFLLCYSSHFNNLLTKQKIRAHEEYLVFLKYATSQKCRAQLSL